MKEKIILATGHAHAFHRASALAAIENGFFRDEGFHEIEIRATGEDGLTVESLITSVIDFGLDVGPGRIIKENSKGQELYIIAGMLNHFDSTLIGAQAIKSLSDLRGRKIGLSEKGDSRDVPWIRMLLRKAGIDPDREVTWVTDIGSAASLNLRGPQLDRGEFHATSLSGHYKRPELYSMVREAGFNILAKRSETHPDGLPDRVVATTGKMLTEYPKVVKSILKGIVRGYRFARNDKNAEKIKEMYLAYDWGKEGFGWGKFDNALMDGMVRSTRELPYDGSISISGLDALIEENKVTGKIPGDFTKHQVLRLGPLQEAVRELNEKFGPVGYV